LRRAATSAAAIGAALAALAPAAADASGVTKLSIRATQHVVQRGQTHQASTGKVITGEVDAGSYTKGPGGRGAFVTKLTRRITTKGVSVSGTSAAVSRTSGIGLCLSFHAAASVPGRPANGDFDLLAGTGAATRDHGSGSYTRSRIDGGFRTTVSGALASGKARHLTVACRKVLNRAGAALPPPVVAAAGDIACPGGDDPTPVSCQQRATSNLLFGPLAGVLALGDNQYNSGTYYEYTTGKNAFDRTWGRVKGRIYPTPGSHEYHDPAGSAAGYYRYWAKGGPFVPGAARKGWYSFDIGAWHILSLNSNCGISGSVTDLGPAGCAAGAPEERWVRADLVANSKSLAGGPKCILAFWHEPLFTSSRSQRNPRLRTIWQDLVSARADVVLNGHQHSYERFAAQDAFGNTAPNGMPEFVVGTGGEDHGVTDHPLAPNSVVQNSSTFGVLRLTLHAGSYDWKFAPIAGSSSGFGDAGTQACHH
jgi:hypothetical protein